MRYGYVLPTRGSVLTSDGPETLAAKTAADVVGLARRAEGLGFDAVWVGDSVLAKPRHEPLAALAGVATATESVGLGTAVHLAPLRHPVHLAHQVATVDQLAGGRLRLGVGVGSGPDIEVEYDQLGVPYGERGARLSELLEVMAALLTGEAVTHDGAHYALEDAGIGFGPVGSVPIYVASARFDPSDGFPAPIRRRLVDHGDGWLPISLSPAQYADGLERIRALLEGAGRDPATFDPALYRDVVIDADPDRAIETARAFYERYYPAWGTLSDEAIRAKGAFGPPAAVAAELEAFAEAGVETMVVRFTTGEQRTQLARLRELAL